MQPYEFTAILDNAFGSGVGVPLQRTINNQLMNQK
jgi:hypothetical protein